MSAAGIGGWFRSDRLTRAVIVGAVVVGTWAAGCRGRQNAGDRASRGQEVEVTDDAAASPYFSDAEVATSSDVWDQEPIPVGYYYDRSLSRDFELAEVVILARIAGCPGKTVELEVLRVFKGEFGVGERVRFGTQSCLGSGFLRGDSSWSEDARVFFAKWADGKDADLLRAIPFGRRSWVTFGLDKDRAQTAEALEELADAERNPTKRVARIHAWLRSRNLHLRMVGLGYAASEKSDEFIADLFQVLRARSSDLHCRATALSTLRGTYGRRADGLPRAGEEPLHDRIMKTLVQLAMQPPAREWDAEAEQAVWAMSKLARERRKIEGIQDSRGGSAARDADPIRAATKCVYGRPGACTDWYLQHGTSVAKSLSAWVESGGHLPEPPLKRDPRAPPADPH